MPGRRQVTERNAVISFHVFAGDAEAVQERIQQKPASRARFAVDNLQIAPREIRDTADIFGLPAPTRIPSSHKAKAMTATESLPNIVIFGRLDSPVFSSRR